MSQLLNAGGEELIKNRVSKGDALIGICVGMQVLFNNSTEKGSHKGLNIFNGMIKYLRKLY